MCYSINNKPYNTFFGFDDPAGYYANVINEFRATIVLSGNFQSKQIATDNYCRKYNANLYLLKISNKQILLRKNKPTLSVFKRIAKNPHK